MKEKNVALVMTLIGALVAIFTPVEQYENFLYAIGSVFGPLFAIVLSDYFIFKKEHISQTLALHVGTSIVWAVGVFILPISSDVIAVGNNSPNDDCNGSFIYCN